MKFKNILRHSDCGGPASLEEVGAAGLCLEHYLTLYEYPGEAVRAQYYLDTKLGFFWDIQDVNPVKVFGLEFYPADKKQLTKHMGWLTDKDLICHTEEADYLLNEDRNEIARIYLSDFNNTDTLVYERWVISDVGDV